ADAAPPPADALRAVAELPQLLEGSGLRRRDAGDREGAHRKPSGRHRALPDPPVDHRQYTLRPGREGARPTRRLVRRRSQHAGSPPQPSPRATTGRPPTNLRGLRVNKAKEQRNPGEFGPPGSVVRPGRNKFRRPVGPGAPPKVVHKALDLGITFFDEA